MIDLHIVIPLGVSTENTPVLSFLKESVNSLKRQNTNFSYSVTFACDNNVRQEVKDFLESTSYNISWYEPFSFVRKGSIWKKIITEWQKVDSKYIAFLHYDDVWDENKIQNQITFMKEKNLDLSWSKVYIIDSNNKIVSGDVAHRNVLNENSLDESQSYAFSHSSILDKQKFLNSDILDYIDESAAIYEHLHYLFSHKLRGLKDNSSIFFHRTHDNSISNSYSSETDFIQMTRKIANYSLQEVMDDVNKVPIEKIKENIKSFGVIYENYS